VVGVNTLIISPTGGSIGLGFAVRRRRWPVWRSAPAVRRIAARLARRPHPASHDDIAESSHQAPRAARWSRIDEKGRKACRHRTGDVVVKFDARTSRTRGSVAAWWPTPRSARKSRSSSSARRGGNQESDARPSRDTDKAQQASAKTKDEPAAEKPVTQKAAGLDLATLTRICAENTRSRTASRA